MAGSLIGLDGKPLTDDWQPLPDDAGSWPETGRWIAPLDWADQRDIPPGEHGLALANTVDVEAEAERLIRASLLQLEWPALADGRAYTQARLLRERLGYRGPIRAIGHVVRDNLWELARCGVDQFALRADQDPAGCAAAFSSFSVVYQRTADRRESVFSRRRESRPA